MTSRNELLDDLSERTIRVRTTTQNFLEAEKEMLYWKPAENVWNVLECIEHLRYYGNFYVPEIRRSIKNGIIDEHAESFKSGWLGNYFAMMMRPGTSKMSTFKSMNPAGKELTPEVLREFILQQDELLNLLKKSRNADLTKTRAGISIAPWLKLRLGDIFRVVIYHNERHLSQAGELLKEYSKSHSKQPL